ncbi:MAG TPA: hypothetical protein VFU43_13620 [Streptosporangiaceae bacterium]|nr:hypothetical protein [Streptosporangiaceae bacterium]
MDRSRALRTVLIASPALILAGFGCVHPAHLGAGTAQWWSTLHVLLLPVFPLLGAAQWVLLADAPVWPRRTGRVAAASFAVYYDGLDAVDGIAAGALVHTQGRWTDATAAVFHIGDRLGHVGAWSFLVAGLAITVAIALRAGLAALPGGLLLLASSVSFLDSHIFWPRGVFTMLGIAGGMSLLAIAGSTRRSPRIAATSGARAAGP